MLSVWKMDVIKRTRTNSSTNASHAAHTVRSSCRFCDWDVSVNRHPACSSAGKLPGVHFFGHKRAPCTGFHSSFLGNEWASSRAPYRQWIWGTWGKRKQGRTLRQKYLWSSKRIDLSCGQSDGRIYCLVQIVPAQPILTLMALLFSIYKAQHKPKHKQKVHA